MPMPTVTAVEHDKVVWRLEDRGSDVDGVRLWSDFDLGDTSFRRVDGHWELRLPRGTLPPVDRLEYLFEVSRGDETVSVLDPGNPLRVGGAFGDHSWVSLGYRPPAWLDVPPVPGERREVTVDGTPVGGVDLQLWSPRGTGSGERLPLLLSHDGPEMDALGGLTRFVGAMIATQRLPPMRVGLLAPGARDERYAANPAYADALCEHVLPAVLQAAPSEKPPVLVGQSLGAVAALHAEWTHPGTFAGLLLESGSFFTPELDAQESGYAHWQAVTEFVAEVLSARSAPSTPPLAVGFGTAEENAANNRLIAAKLASLGCPAALGEVRDGHTFTCWRDLLDPHLTDLLRRI
jgi:enterochelin esterase family protein